jgi:hypothetical protein
VTLPLVLELAMHGYGSAVAPGQKKLGRHTEQLRAAPNKPGTHAQLLSCALPTSAEEFGLPVCLLSDISSAVAVVLPLSLAVPSALKKDTDDCRGVTSAS